MGRANDKQPATLLEWCLPWAIGHRTERIQLMEWGPPAFSKGANQSAHRIVGNPKKPEERELDRLSSSKQNGAEELKRITL